jgi:uncharacterized membrane protein YedE/YeeE
MWNVLREPWPWYVGGPVIGLMVPVLLIAGNKQLGVSSALRAICAATVPGRVEFFRYDWKATGLWNVALAAGVLIGALLAVSALGSSTPNVAQPTRDALAAVGVAPVHGLLPAELFSWRELLTVRGLVLMVGGGFLVGFGASYGGGCTSGHGVMGMATLQRASMIALVGIFAGGLVATFVLLPIVLRLP